MEKSLNNKVYEHCKTFAKNIRFERNSKGLTQKEIADAIGIKTQSYQAYESGVSLPSSENLLKLAIILEVSIDELFELK
ncbi:MAG: helix-turn-helix transcriptional regulator [Clostridia bacterium]|nr:helix-turn-helix transcriptional regulator [Clostridia bacterium]